MARVNAQEAARKWRERTAAAAGDYTRGVERVTEAPGAAAARNAQAALINYTEMINSGEWARRVGGVSLQDWKAATTGKGAQRLATGVQAAESRMSQAMADLLPQVDAASAHVRSMPNVTLEDRIARMVEFTRRMAQRPGGRK